MNKKILKPILASGLIASMVVGGSLAYINATTDQIDNKFVFAHAGDDGNTLVIDLSEEFTLNGEDVSKLPDGTASFLPGDEIIKQPVVSIASNELEDGAYVFVELKGNGIDSILGDSGLGFEVDTTNWTLVPDETHVYYQVVNKISDGTPVNLPVFSTDTITIPTDFSGSNFNTVQTLTLDAYAIQVANLDNAKVAWAAVCAE